MTPEPKRPNFRHVELAQKILDVAGERGMAPGERLAEQALASLCKVSRTPIRKALQILAGRDMVTSDSEGGYLLAVDPAATGGFGPLQSLHLEADAGHVLVAGAGELIVVVLAAKDAQLGLVRLETLRAAESLS